MTDSVIAGALMGLMMASVFVAVGAIILLPYVDPRSPQVQMLVERGGNSRRFVMVVLAFYPAWAVIGALAGLVLVAFERGVPGGGLGSPNLAFTAALLGFTLLGSAPAAMLLRRSAPAVVTMGLAFAGLFGWALPHFAG